MIVLVFTFLFILFFCLNIPGRDNIPSGQNLIKNSPGLFVAVNSPFLQPYDCHNETTFKHYVKNIDDLLRPYLASTGPDCYGGGNHNGNCTFDPKLLGSCFKKDYGFASGTPCFYLKLSKIVNYIPKGHNHYIPLICHYHGTNKNPIEMSIHPTGILLDALPYTYEQQNTYLSPLVAVKIPANMDVIVRCLLISKDIPTHGSYAHEHSVGKIEIKINKMKNHYPCPMSPYNN